MDELHSTRVSLIIRLPPEVLSLVLSFAIPPEPHATPHGVVIRLRSVCRRMRTLIDQLPFWLHDAFTFYQLCPTRQLPEPESKARIAAFALNLLQDRHLREHLGRRKRRWSVTSLEMFKVLVQMIPGFKETTEWLLFSDLTGFGDLSALLKGFTNLGQLSVWSQCPIQVGTLPPSLRHLRFDHSPPSTTCTCNFQSIEHLDHFELNHYKFGWIPRLDCLLPMKSSATLQTLALHLAPIVEFSRLDSFPNVTNLSVMTGRSSFFQYLQNSVLGLDTFHVTVANVDAFVGFTTALTSPSLRAVERLRVGANFDPDDPDPVREALEPVLATIAEMPLLESVSFSAPLRKDWSVYLRRFRRLQSLRWNIWFPSAEIDEVRTAFEAALEHIHPTPRVEVFD
jgi:F-box domain